MALLTLKDIDKTHGLRHLLRGVSLVVEPGARLGLVGANGAGKSTLLRIAAGLEPADGGERTERGGLRLAYLEQEPRLDPDRTIRAEVRRGFAERGAVLAELDRVHEALADGAADTRALLRRQAELEGELALLGGHDIEHRVEKVVRNLGLPDPDAVCGALSGGERRRVALAQLLLGEPDLMLLDEPTNHLDALVTEWLEDRLLATNAALLMVTHDRYFLDRVVDGIVELEDGVLHAYEGGYGEFLVARAARLDAARQAEATRLNLLRRETAWMRRGPPGRSTKAKARIRRFHALVDGEAVETPTEPEFTIPPGPRLGSKVIRLHGVAKSYGGAPVLSGLDLDIGAGDRIGIVGPNGAGKTTLLRTCLGELAPDAGRVEIGSTVRFARITQGRDELDPDKDVVRTVGHGNTWVKVGGRDLRVESFLERFLFPPALFRTPVGKLSGGERNRVLLARMLLEDGNVLVLDEPTNDLDLMTLRVLEEALIAFPGTVLVVSHDRYFLDRVATRIVYLDGTGGRARLHAGDMSSLIRTMREEAAPARAKKAPSTARSAPEKRRTWKEKQELQALPDKIAAAEAELARLDAQLAEPDFYAGPEARIKDVTARRAAVADEVAALYARWEALEG